MIPQTIPIVGAHPTFERRLRAVLARMPPMYLRAGRVTRLEASGAENVRKSIAVYSHGSRVVQVWPGVGDILDRALFHEWAHAVDDNFDQPHYFSATEEWMRIHRDQTNFDLQHYRDEALEYFADMMAKYFLIGPAKLGMTRPNEVTFIASWVLPTLENAFG